MRSLRRTDSSGECGRLVIRADLDEDRVVVDLVFTLRVAGLRLVDPLGLPGPRPDLEPLPARMLAFTGMGLESRRL